MNKPDSLDIISNQIIDCQRCPRLAAYVRLVAINKTSRYKDSKYWGRPVPGFGDPDPKLYILGLAPGAHGANRTGRVFTGDTSGDWLFGALYETGFANKPDSMDIYDGLKLNGAYIGASTRCAPPDNKPLQQEINNCSEYILRELALFQNLKIVLCLGRIAFFNFCRLQNVKEVSFSHGTEYLLSNGLWLISSYHPSPQNTNTGKLKWNEWLEVFLKIRKKIGSS